MSIRTILSKATIPFIVITAFAAPAAAIPSRMAGADEPLLKYSLEGSMWSPQYVSLSIGTDGAGYVEFKRRARGDGKTPVQLSEDEMATLKTYVEVGDFFAAPAGESRYNDAGDRVIEVNMQGKTHKVILDMNQSPGSCLWPLADFCFRLAEQGMIIHDLKVQQRYRRNVVGSVSSNPTVRKVLQPRALKKPLQDFIRVAKRREQLTDGISALSWVLSAEEWMGFLAREMERANEKRKLFLLKAFTGVSPVPEGHRNSLAMLFVKYLWDDYKQWGDFSDEKKQVWGNMIRILGQQQSYCAAGILGAMVIEGYAVDHYSWLGWALPHLGAAAIEELEPLLDHADENVRAPTAEMLGKILVMKQKGLGEKGREYILGLLRGSVKDNLEELSKSDRSGWVRKAAKRSLEQIEKGWGN